MRVQIASMTLFFPQEMGFTKQMIASILVGTALDCNRVDEEYKEHLIASVETQITDDMAQEYVDTYGTWLKDGLSDSEEVEEMVVNRLLPMLIMTQQIISDNDKTFE